MQEGDIQEPYAVLCIALCIHERSGKGGKSLLRIQAILTGEMRAD